MSSLSEPATTPLSPENQVELKALRRHLRRASGFSLAFVVVNHPSTRDEVVRELAVATGGVAIRLRRGAGGPVPQIEAALGDTAPPVVFLLELESLVDDGPSPALDNLNLNRDFLARRLACPLVILGPAWLAATLARGATDLWSVRSNVFELVGDADAGRASVEHASRGLTWEVTAEEREPRPACSRTWRRKRSSRARTTLGTWPRWRRREATPPACWTATRRPRGSTTRRWSSTARSATAWARPMPSGAWATPPACWTATRRPRGAITRRWCCTARSATGWARPTPSTPWATPPAC